MREFVLGVQDWHQKLTPEQQQQELVSVLVNPPRTVFLARAVEAFLKAYDEKKALPR